MMLEVEYKPVRHKSYEIALSQVLEDVRTGRWQENFVSLCILFDQCGIDQQYYSLIVQQTLDTLIIKDKAGLKADPTDLTSLAQLLAFTNECISLQKLRKNFH